MNALKDKKILLGITGSVAVQKIPQFVVKLIQKEARVKIILTNSAKKLLTNSELTELKRITSGEVYEDLFEKGREMSHIYLTRESDLFLIAPATAQSIASLAQGKADNLLTATALASNIPIWIAPAMNREMYANEVVEQNLKFLTRLKNYHLIEPDNGRLACNEYGIGRLTDIDNLICQIEGFFTPQILKNKKVLITLGASVEKIDPVRYISNFSSGKMGFATAKAFSDLGAEVVLIQARVDEAIPIKNSTTIKAMSAKEIYKQSLKQIDKLAENNKVFDYFVAVAAVSDFRVKKIANNKIKKQSQNLNLELVKNPDTLKKVSGLKKFRPKVIIGFAAETQNLQTNAKEKLKNKNLDFICANLVGEDKAFGKAQNELIVLNKKQHKKFKLTDKRVLAKKLVSFFVNQTH